MIAQATHDLVWVAAIGVIPATIAAIGTMRNATGLKSAKAAAVVAKEEAKNTRDEFREAIHDGNGNVNIGVNIHETAKAVEALTAQVAVNTEALMGISQKVDDHAGKLEAHVADSDAWRAKLGPVIDQLSQTEAGKPSLDETEG